MERKHCKLNHVLDVMLKHLNRINPRNQDDNADIVQNIYIQKIHGKIDPNDMSKNDNYWRVVAKRAFLDMKRKEKVRPKYTGIEGLYATPSSNMDALDLKVLERLTPKYALFIERMMASDPNAGNGSRGDIEKSLYDRWYKEEGYRLATVHMLWHKSHDEITRVMKDM